MNDIIEVRVIAKACKTKDGKTFTAYRAVQKDGKLIDCHFRKVCGVLPEANFIMKAKKGDLKINKSYLYPRLWVKGIVEIVNPETTAAAVEDFPF